MVGLAEDGNVYEDKGFTAERMSESLRLLSQAHHMPIDTSLRPRMAGTIPACRAVVAVRRHQPEQERAMLRALRVLHFSGHLLDEPATLSAAAQRVGIEPTDLHESVAEPETEALLREDNGARAPPAGRRSGAGPQAGPHRNGPSLHVSVIRDRASE